MQIRPLVILLAIGGTLLAVEARAQVPEEPCPFPVTGTPEDSWRLVRAEGFTFCVPSSWKPAGRAGRDGLSPRKWRGRRGSIEWGKGEYRRETRTGTMTVMVEVDENRPLMLPTPPPPDVRNFTEVIDGRPAEMWDNRFGSTFSTGANWRDPHVHVAGEASDHATVRLQMTIYRTVRFVEP